MQTPLFGLCMTSNKDWILNVFSILIPGRGEKNQTIFVMGFSSLINQASKIMSSESKVRKTWLIQMCIFLPGSNIYCYILYDEISIFLELHTNIPQSDLLWHYFNNYPALHILTPWIPNLTVGSKKKHLFLYDWHVKTICSNPKAERLV